MARRFARHPDARHYYWLVNHTGQILDRCAIAPRNARRDRGLRTDSYIPTVRIARHVITRDQHCVAPGCRRRAHTCELDHRRPWPDGDTTAQNLQALCKRHHDMKHRSRWRIRREQDAYRWTSPTNHTYRYRPPELPVTEAPPPATLEEDPPPF